MQKIKTGVPGLNRLLEGGLNPHTVSVVIGPAGAGKTTIGVQYIRRGIYDNKECIFVSLDETKDQIIRTAINMGFTDIEDYIAEEQLFFIDISGKSFSDYINDELPALINEWKTADTIIAIDPLTPVIWSVKELYEQRELIGTLFKLTKKIGTVLCTLEEHSPGGMGPEVVVPTYLADTVIRLEYVPPSTRILKITKSRDIHHSDESHPYAIVKGLGIVVKPQLSAAEMEKRTYLNPDEILSDRRLSQLSPAMRERVLQLIKLMKNYRYYHLTPNEVVECILDEFKD